MDKVIVVPRTMNVLGPRCCRNRFSVSTPFAGRVGARWAGPGPVHADGGPGVRGGGISSEAGQPQGVMAVGQPQGSLWSETGGQIRAMAGRR